MVQKATSRLMQKYGAGLHKAVVSHADDDIMVRGGKLPSGITNGVAQVTECGFKQYEKGTNMKTADGRSAYNDKNPSDSEYFFFATGIVMEDFPNDKDAPTRGLQLRVGNGFGIPVFDTKKADGTIVTQDEHVAEIEDILKRLGIPKESFTGGDVLEGLAEAVQEAQPYFAFSTSLATKPSQDGSFRTWENWGGTKGLEDYSPPSADSAVQDNTAKGAPEPEPPFGDKLDDLVVECNSEDVNTAADATAKMTAQAAELGIDASTIDTWKEVAQAIRDAQAGGGKADYAALGTAAENGDQEAADRLDSARQEAGMDDGIYGTMSWEELATWLTDAAGSANAGDGPAWAPVKGEVYKYKPTDPKTRRKVAKAIECEVVSVSGDNVTMKNLVDGKVIMNPATKKPLLVPWTELEQ